VTKSIVPSAPTLSINYILRVVESKGKGKALPTMDYEDMQDDDEWASEFSSEDEDDLDLSKAYMSVCACQVQEILSGTEGTAPGASGSSFVAGRVTEIVLRTPGKFRLTHEALSMAHNEGCPKVIGGNPPIRLALPPERAQRKGAPLRNQTLGSARLGGEDAL